jgi:hypothetical protein
VQLLKLSDLAEAVIPDQPIDQLGPVAVRHHLRSASLDHELETMIDQRAPDSLRAIFLSHGQKQILADDPVAGLLDAKSGDSGCGAGALCD